MTEKELIGKLKNLRQIKPRKDWVCSTKSQILGETPRFTFTFFPYFKPALAGFVAVLVFFGFFGFTKNSLPGDTLYPIKKVMEKSQAVFVSPDEQPAFQLGLANERLEELTCAPVENLGPTINEFQASISEAAKNLSRIEATTSDPVAIRKFVEETKRFKENKQKVEALGVVIEGKETEELEMALGLVVENLISDLESRSLTEDKEEILEEMKEFFTERKYSEVLELYLINQ